MRSDSKPYELFLEVRADYLYARVTADEVDRHSAIDYVYKVAAVCNEKNLHKILIDRRVPMMLADSENYLLILEMTHVLGKKKVAYVNPFEQLDDKMSMNEMVSRNRNVPYRVFRTEEDAVRWLESDAADTNIHASDG
ncbi:MAG: hypothetical protein K1X52_00290 [Pyrinomonadaceae bacterium]|nr:hypothetical protein [Pyrinomonadaceae bacterium]